MGNALIRARVSVASICLMCTPLSATAKSLAILHRWALRSAVSSCVYAALRQGATRRCQSGLRSRAELIEPFSPRLHAKRTAEGGRAQPRPIQRATATRPNTSAVSAGAHLSVVFPLESRTREARSLLARQVEALLVPRDQLAERLRTLHLRVPQLQAGGERTSGRWARCFRRRNETKASLCSPAESAGARLC